MKITATLFAILLCVASSAAMAQAPAGQSTMSPPPPPWTLPPPASKNPGAPSAVGTVAPDGVGVAVRDNTLTLGTMNSETMTYTPWVDDSVVKPLPVGAKIPQGSVVRTMDDKAFDLNAAVASKPTVLIFYRGGWCPFCNQHLRELQKSVGPLQEMGYQLLAVSPDTPARLSKTEKDANLTYQLLSDKDVAVAAKFGLRYKISQQYIDHVKSTPSHTDLAELSSGYMLTPGAYVIDTQGVIRFAYVNNNYTVRVSQTALLDAARAALTPPSN